jgi:hypothetical protein
VDKPTYRSGEEIIFTSAPKLFAGTVTAMQDKEILKFSS